MPRYKLFYFDARGGGELIRLVFAEAGVDYEDIRYDRETWLTHKQEMPFGQIPVLGVDGNKLAQSVTIARFLANRFGLAGADEWEKALVDSYVDAMSDVAKICRTVIFEKDETKKAELLENFKTEWPKKLEPFEKALELNEKHGFLVGQTVTWGDLCFLDFADRMERHMQASLEHFPRCKKLVDQISERPKIKAWLESRPQTHF